ncbi:MAG: hypothetical protein P3W93_004220 [Thermus sp.]|nr:hypothetical protein [Thermus sp.]
MVKKALWYRLARLGTSLVVPADRKKNPAKSTPQALQVAGAVEGTPAEPTLLGMPLDLQGGSLRIQSLEARVERKGLITALDTNAGTLTVLGQPL